VLKRVVYIVTTVPYRIKNRNFYLLHTTNFCIRNTIFFLLSNERNDPNKTISSVQREWEQGHMSNCEIEKDVCGRKPPINRERT